MAGACRVHLSDLPSCLHDGLYVAPAGNLLDQLKAAHGPENGDDIGITNDLHTQRPHRRPDPPVRTPMSLGQGFTIIRTQPELIQF